MADALSAQDLLADLREQAAMLGLSVRDGAHRELLGEVASIGAKWWLGGRKVNYKMACRLAEAERRLHFREAVVEKSWGIPPPTLTVEKTTVSGWKRSGERTDVSLGGGGKLDYARVREAVERAAVAAGWRFQLEGGRMP
ncbi:MAG: hypothetical protein HY244_19115 [Rhizobiales bacterium]|nr:hypothetical protein [Hyphomicrobiales bacterium]